MEENKKSWVNLHSASKRLDRTTEATRKLLIRKRLKGIKTLDNRWLVSVESLEYYANNCSRAFEEVQQEAV